MDQRVKTTSRSFAVGVLAELALARSVDALARALERLACQIAVASRARLYTYDGDAQTLTEAARGDDAPQTLSISDPNAIVARCAATTQPFTAEGRIALPLLAHGGLVGALLVEDARLPAQDALLDSLAEACAVAALQLGLVRDIEDLERFQVRTQDVLVRALERVSGETGHVERLSTVAAELASRLDLSTRSRRLIWQAAQYHDVGRILLTEDDADLHHPAAGAEWLANSARLRAVARLVELHHARWDGSGTPPAKGDEVPLEGWVLALAEDLEDGYRTHPDQDLIDWLPDFIEARAAGHHPAVLEALRLLGESGRLEAIYAR